MTNEIRNRLAAVTSAPWSEERNGRTVSTLPYSLPAEMPAADQLFVLRAAEDIRWLLERVAELEGSHE